MDAALFADLEHQGSGGLLPAGAVGKLDESTRLRSGAVHLGGVFVSGVTGRRLTLHVGREQSLVLGRRENVPILGLARTGVTLDACIDPEPGEQRRVEARVALVRHKPDSGADTPGGATSLPTLEREQLGANVVLPAGTGLMLVRRRPGTGDEASALVLVLRVRGL
jgi:hypothetical protein